MAQDRMKEKERLDESQPGRRIVKTYYEQTTRVIELKIFVVRPDGKKARVLGGGAFEQQDLDRVAQELVNLANDLHTTNPSKKSKREKSSTNPSKKF